MSFVCGVAISTYLFSTYQLEKLCFEAAISTEKLTDIRHPSLNSHIVPCQWQKWPFVGAISGTKKKHDEFHQPHFGGQHVRQILSAVRPPDPATKSTTKTWTGIVHQLDIDVQYHKLGFYPYPCCIISPYCTIDVIYIYIIYINDHLSYQFLFVNFFTVHEVGWDWYLTNSEILPIFRGLVLLVPAVEDSTRDSPVSVIGPSQVWEGSFEDLIKSSHA